jgi:hypothetical protein
MVGMLIKSGDAAFDFVYRGGGGEPLFQGFNLSVKAGEHVYLLDLDLASMGPAELDVGNYLAHLDEYGIRFPSDKDRCSELGKHFLEGYLARSEKGCERSIEIWRKLALARHIAISTRISDRSHTTRDLLDTMLA